MKNSRFIISAMLLLVGVSMLSSCNDTEDKVEKKAQTFDKEVIISRSGYDNAPEDKVVINELKIKDDLLIVNFSASGCSGKTWIVQLIDTGATHYSNPPQRILRLSLQNNEGCEAFITKEMSFNIKNLRIEGDSKIFLNVSGKKILYEY